MFCYYDANNKYVSLINILKIKKNIEIINI